MVYNAVEEQNKFLSSYSDLKDLSFALNRSDIKSIELYSYKAIGWYPQKHSLIKWKWIRIVCNENILDGDFLICVDGVDNTKLLFEMLNQFNEFHAISTTLKDFSNTKMVKIGYMGMILLFISLTTHLISSILYGTINVNIGGPITVISLFLGFLLFIIASICALTKIRQNTKILYHMQLICFISIFSYLISFFLFRFN